VYTRQKAKLNAKLEIKLSLNPKAQPLVVVTPHEHLMILLLINLDVAYFIITFFYLHFTGPNLTQYFEFFILNYSQNI